MLPALAPSREMNTLQPNGVPIGSGTQTFSSTTVSNMDSMRTLEIASTKRLFFKKDLDNGTSSELNTPEVEYNDWKFQRQPSYGRNDDVFHAVEKLSKADNLDPYFSFASSDPLEQRMNLEGYSGGVNSYGYLPEGSFSRDLVNDYSIVRPKPSLGGALAEEEPLGVDIFPSLGDKDFKLPSDIEQLMEEILPSENENVVNNSTDFDMFIGSQDPLAEAIKFTGIMEDEDPSWSNLDKVVTTNLEDTGLSDEVTTVNMGDIGLSDVTLSPASSSVYIPEPAELTPLPDYAEIPHEPEHPVSVITVPKSRHTGKKHHRNCRKKQGDMDPEPVTTINLGDISLSGGATSPPTSTLVFTSEPTEVPLFPDHVEVPSATETEDRVSVTRSRRRVKKPDRYRVAVQDDEEGMDFDLVEANVPSPSSYSRKQRLSLAHMTEEEKYARIRKLNNEASKRCRTNKRKHLETMAKEVKTLTAENEQLHKRVSHLESLRDQMKVFVHNFFRDQMASVKK